MLNVIMLWFLTAIICSLSLIQNCRSVCWPQPLPTNAFVSASCRGTQRSGTICQIQCRSGYALQGSAVRVCQRNSLWSGRPVRCVPQNSQQRTCPPIKELENGFVLNSCDNRFAIGCRLTFACNQNHTLNGDRMATCLRGGQWSTVKPKCDAVVPTRCPTLGAPSGGLWINRQNYYECIGEPGVTCSLECRPGYALVGPTYTYCDTKTRVWSQPIPTCVRE